MPVDPNQTDEIFDVVIIGAGAAGITLALQFAEAGIKTALVEGGGYKHSDQSQKIYNGFNEGLSYPLQASRLRFWGGSTNHWTGWCRPFDDKAFMPRPEIDYPGWSIGSEQLIPYLSKALEIVEIDPASTWEPDATPDNRSNFDQAISDSDFNEIYFRWSPPTRFKDKYIEQLEQDDNITLSVNDSLINFEYTPEGEIIGAVLRNLTTHDDRTVYGKQFVLACGGIENARLLLHINAENGVDFGNHSGYLGKYFMEHPHFYEAVEFVMVDRVYEHDVLPAPSAPWQYMYRFFCPTNNFLKAHDILDSTIRMRMYQHRKDMLSSIDELSTITTLSGKDNWQAGVLDIVVEQPPLITNAITLSDETDDLGLRKTILNWRLTDIDYKSTRQPLLAFAKFLVEADLGRCKLASWVTDEQEIPEQQPGMHHMGTTRMARTESEGVVDTDCKLYGIKNLYIAGSSVYPTGASINPTLTLVQLALRLADHLKSRLSE